MSSKTTIVIVLLVIGGLVLWHVIADKDSAAHTAVENVGLSIEEAILPKQGHPDDAAIIRKAMIEQRKKENSEWTPSNIYAHPELYLAHCQKMLTAYLEQYGAAILEARTEINKNEREIQNSEDNGQSLIGFLKAAHAALGDSSLKYPAKIGLYTYSDAGQVQSAVVKTDKRMTEIERGIASKKQLVADLKVTLVQLEKDKERIERELQGLTARVEQVKSGAIKRYVDQIRDRIDALLSGADALPEIEDAAPGIGGIEPAQETAGDVFKRRNIN